MDADDCDSLPARSFAVLVLAALVMVGLLVGLLLPRVAGLPLPRVGLLLPRLRVLPTTTRRHVPPRGDLEQDHSLDR